MESEGIMAKCQHKNVIITEYQTERLVWQVSEGVLPDKAEIEADDVLPMLNVKCPECGLHRTYNRSRKLPQWLDQYVDGYQMNHGQ